MYDIYNSRYKTPKKFPILFHNDSTYDYHFIIKELAEKFKGQFKCLGENTEKYITFSVPIKNQITEIDKDGKDKIVNISYKIKFIGCFSLMNNSVFEKTMENVRKHRDIKLVKTDKWKNQLVAEPNYHAIKGISENLVATK